MNERLRTWGANIQRTRKLIGMTQAQLANSLGVVQSSVARWEKGECAPRDDMRVEIAQVLHQDVSMLFPSFRPAAKAS